MFNMRSVGKKIYDLRKKANMTQVNLADELGISYQAVSSWERGNSMPDIEKIPEIAKLFHVSIDELIGESKVVTAILTCKEDEQPNYADLEEKDIVEALPILKPTQIMSMFDSIDKSKLKNWELFLPFMEEKDVKELAVEACKKGADISEFLPFIDEGDLRSFLAMYLSR